MHHELVSFPVGIHRHRLGACGDQLSDSVEVSERIETEQHGVLLSAVATSHQCRAAGVCGDPAVAWSQPTCLAGRAFGQVVMDEPNSHRALTDGGGHPLDGTASNVSHREHSWTAGLEHGGATTFAARGVPHPDGLIDEVVTSEDIAAIVQRQLVTQPGDMWIGADEDEQCSRLLGAS